MWLAWFRSPSKLLGESKNTAWEYSFPASAQPSSAFLWPFEEESACRKDCSNWQANSGADVVIKKMFQNIFLLLSIVTFICITAKAWKPLLALKFTCKTLVNLSSEVEKPLHSVGDTAKTK